MKQHKIEIIHGKRMIINDCNSLDAIVLDLISFSRFCYSRTMEKLSSWGRFRQNGTKRHEEKLFNFDTETRRKSVVCVWCHGTKWTNIHDLSERERTNIETDKTREQNFVIPMTMHVPKNLFPFVNVLALGNKTITEDPQNTQKWERWWWGKDINILYAVHIYRLIPCERSKDRNR